MSTLHVTFIETLKDTYDAEQQIIKALPKVIKHAESDELRQALENHLEESKEHSERLEQVFEMFDEKPGAKKCAGMAGLIAEVEEVMNEGKSEAAMMLALQKVEHYEIAAYGALVSWAKLLHEEEASDILEETLAEEIETDEKLNDLPENILNMGESGDEEQRKAA
jgi:ferritin-like metal-binding protein YciE